ncbi:MAG: dihydrolipoyl dehydrogenase [Phycisphaeraceae bacterium]|nr:MAG: dihydrolipoyl dehydrogenase [Phycisphaeraceae bacterium]
MAEKHYDLIVIGGGPAGYVGAIRAAQLGLKTLCIERDKLGGVCLNWGCIPTKALLANAELYEKAHGEGAAWGLEFDHLRVNWEKVIGRSRGVADKLNKGIGFLFKKNKIDHEQAHAKIVSGRKGDKPCKVELYDCTVKDTLTHAPADIEKKPRATVTADNILVATGSVARDLPFAKFDGDKIIGAREAMNQPSMPESMVIVGAGAIGMEFAYFYHTFGTKVTVIEMLPRILPVEDEEICSALEKHYKKAGMDIRTSTTTTAVETTKKGVKVTVAPFKDGKADEKNKKTIEADKVLLAIGVKGRYDGLFDDALGLEIEKDHIKTDYKPGKTQSEEITYKTNIDGIYAVGDIIGAPWLAHVASEEAILAVERIAGHDPIPLDYSTIPGCTYCHPQVASVGFTERALKDEGMKAGEDYQVGKFPLQSHGKAIASNSNVGLIKIIRGLPRGEILGAHLMCDQATELIGEMGLARRLEATSEELIVTVHAHPTMYEALHEAALASEGRVIHG